MKIGIIGQGFVGSAIREGLKSFYDVMTYDLDVKKCNSTHEQVCRESSIIFVCVPTPMRKSGECDTRILEHAIEKIDRSCFDLGTSPTLVIKSTVPPGTTKRINQTVVKNISVCFSPEFLTEANSFEDFKNQKRIIIGGKGARKVKQMFRKPFPDVSIVITKSETAEMVKYFINCFLASKVTYANQMYDICESSNIDYDKVCEYALLDKRIGASHLAVPGPDGDRGYGGHCFPKDLAAIIYFAKKSGTQHDFLDQVNNSNDKYRNNKDWLSMKGRAVSED
jgi:nucleotide sugar dehydrogenase